MYAVKDDTKIKFNISVIYKEKLFSCGWGGEDRWLLV